MTRALDHTALSKSRPAETLPLHLAVTARDHGGAPAMRHKRSGIWRTWTFADYLAEVAAMARRLDARGLAPGACLLIIGENRPELYAAILAAQGLGACAMPLSVDFLDRFGAPQGPTHMVLCDSDGAARAFRATGGTTTPVFTLDDLLTMEDVRGDEAIGWFTDRAARAAPDAPALILHTSGRNGAPQKVMLTHTRLLVTGRASISAFGLGVMDRAMAFLPMSGIADASTSLVQSLLAGYCVHCVEGPATFPTDLRDVAPTYLVAPAWAFEKIDASIGQRMSVAGPLMRVLRGAAMRGAFGTSLLFSAPLLNAVGLRRCRVAIATGEEPEPQMMRRWRALSVPLQTGTLSTEAGGLVACSPDPFAPAPSRLGSAEHSDAALEAIGADVDAASRSAADRVQALLRSHGEIERAFVASAPGGVIAHLALDGPRLVRDLQRKGVAVADGAALADQPAVHDILRQRIAATNEALARELHLPAIWIAGYEILPRGFGPKDLTLDGAVRHVQNPEHPVLAACGGAAVPTGGGVPLSPRRVAGDVLLEVKGIQVAFGGVKALSDVSLDVRAGEILSIIGPNGAGKTSLLNVINGVYHPRAGTITFRGKVRSRMRPAFAARSGIGRTFQHVSLFKGMSVLDNVLVGRAARFHASLLAKALRLPGAVREESTERAAVERVLAFLDLEHLRKAPVGTLPYGIQKRVELARALATEPGLLLLDEPMAGMTHEEKQEMCRFIRAVNHSFGTTVLLIEHDIGVVMGLSDRVVVLNYGRKIADGTPDVVRADPDVIAAYLGSSAVGRAAA